MSASISFSKCVEEHEVNEIDGGDYQLNSTPVIGERVVFEKATRQTASKDR